MLHAEPGLTLLDSSQATCADVQGPRFSYVAARPFLEFRTKGSRCETWMPLHGLVRVQYGNPWHLLAEAVARYEMLDSPDVPVPAGGCFGFWGYGLKRFVEPRLVEHAERDLDLPDCHLRFYSSYLVFDHVLEQAFVLSTGLQADGSWSRRVEREEASRWEMLLEQAEPGLGYENDDPVPLGPAAHEAVAAPVHSCLERHGFLSAVRKAQHWIRHGHIYQVNLSQRLSAQLATTPWSFFRRMSAAARAPHSAYLDFGDFQIASCSPELFLRMNGAEVITCPIKGSRPAAPNAAEAGRLARELCSSPKERAELIMITDLLRNDLGRVCEFGSIRVPELARLETHPYVLHLVSRVEGQLRPGLGHVQALAACFPGGSITGAPKCRAMEIIEELEPVARGVYTGALGYLGFNGHSQLSIAIRTAVILGGNVYYGTGAGIVADSDPAAEYEETLVKARIFLEGLRAVGRARPIVKRDA